MTETLVLHIFTAVLKDFLVFKFFIIRHLHNGGRNPFSGRHFLFTITVNSVHTQLRFLANITYLLTATDQS